MVLLPLIIMTYSGLENTELVNVRKGTSLYVEVISYIISSSFDSNSLKYNERRGVNMFSLYDNILRTCKVNTVAE